MCWEWRECRWTPLVARKGWNHCPNWRMASDYCQISSFIYFLSSYSRASFMACSFSRRIRPISLLSYRFAYPLKYVTPSSIESICRASNEYHDIAHCTPLEVRRTSLGDWRKIGGRLHWTIGCGGGASHLKVRVLGLCLCLQLRLLCGIILTLG